MTHTNSELTTADQAHYLQVYKRYPIVFERGEGHWLWDIEGRRYLDLLAGIAVNSLGHCHPAVVQAIQEQAGRLMHISNFFASPPQIALAEKLKSLSGLDRVFLTNSGAESVEGAFKCARKYGHRHGKSGTIIYMSGSFHGRTLATIAAGKAAAQQGFEPIPGGFLKAPFNDFPALKAAVAESNPAAIILEPVQGEGGIHVAEPDYLKAVRQLCTDENIVLIMDEIQTGMCRTGSWFASMQADVRPDILTLAKALGGGFPVGAFLTTEAINEAMAFGDHGTTFGGNPLACAAALAAIGVMEAEGLATRAELTGDRIMAGIRKRNHPLVQEVRGLGLMIGIALTMESKPIVAELLERGIIANATADNVVRLVPPLNIPVDALEEAIEVLFEILDQHQSSSK